VAITFFQARGHLPRCRASPLIGWYQIILLGNEHLVMTIKVVIIIATTIDVSWKPFAVVCDLALFQMPNQQCQSTKNERKEVAAVY